VWGVLSAMVRSLHDVPMKLHEALLGHPAPGGAPSSSITTADDLAALLLDQGLGTELAVRWVTSLADNLQAAHIHLLAHISRVFKAKVLGRGRPFGPGFKAQPLIRVLKPLISDVAHLLVLCVMGCHGVRVETGSSAGTTAPSTTSSHDATMSQTASPLRPTLRRQSDNSQGSSNDLTKERFFLADQLSQLRTVRTRHSSAASTLTLSTLGEQELIGLDAATKLSAIFSAVCNALTLEMRHVRTALEAELAALTHVADIPRCSDLLLWAVFMRGAWSALMHRLDMAMLRFGMDETFVSAFSALSWRLTSLLQGLVGLIQERVVLLNVHWIRAHLLQDIINQVGNSNA
jgi:hypothetical protein